MLLSAKYNNLSKGGKRIEHGKGERAINVCR